MNTNTFRKRFEPSGLVGRWVFDGYSKNRDGTVLDQTGNGANGTISGGAQTGSFPEGQLILDGTNDYIAMSNVPKTNLYWALTKDADFAGWPQGVPKLHTQGFARNATHGWICQIVSPRIDRVVISGTTANDWTLANSNLSPLDGLPGGVNHIGSMGLYDDSGTLTLVAPVEVDGSWANRKLVKYNATSLERIGYFDIPETDEASGVSVDLDGTIYISSYYQKRIYRYHWDGAYISPYIALQEGPWYGSQSTVQGITMEPKTGLFCLSGNWSRQQVFDRSGNFMRYWTMDNYGSNLGFQGLCAYGDYLYLAVEHASDPNVRLIVRYSGLESVSDGATLVAWGSLDADHPSSHQTLASLLKGVSPELFRTSSFLARNVTNTPASIWSTTLSWGDPAGPTLDTGRLYMVAVRVRWNQSADLFINGNTTPVSTASWNWGASSADWSFERVMFGANSAGEYLKGRVAMAELYKRPLSPGEIAALYSQGPT